MASCGRMDRQEPTNMFLPQINAEGAFVRKASVFRNWIKADGSTQFRPEANRYHLYVSYACPWANRTLIVRHLKGLEGVISFDVVHWLLNEDGWYFDANCPGATTDSVLGFKYIYEVYLQASKNAGFDGYDGRDTVPILFDKKTGLIVNNESSEIIRMLNSEFNDFCPTEAQRNLDLYPLSLRSQIDDVNNWVYPMINDGVYKAGFATSQNAYDAAVAEVFSGLNKAEEILSRQRYLAGDQLTEADIRLFVTLVRFDSVYHLHFKCNRKRIIDYPNLWAHTRDIYQTAEIKKTINMEHIVKHYHVSHKNINPYGIVPINPILDFEAPHNRNSL